ncbi:MAG: hypothetical protein O3A63_16930 [Proteobacteria bacterium]|nr:hypothetical protein [Pseudomonadota bacterium]
MFTALAQSLAERFVQTACGPTVASDVRGFGDLVVLINPAFEATLFALLSDLSAARGTYFASQLPVLAILTSEADQATRLAFPAGRWFSTFLEAERDPRRYNATTKQFEVIDAESANRTAIGHFSPYRTHCLYLEENGSLQALSYYTAESAAQTFYRTSIAWESDAPGSKIDFDGLTLERTANTAGRNPYLSIYVDGELIRGHNDIDDPRIIRFIEQLVLISSQPENPVQRARARK